MRIVDPLNIANWNEMLESVDEATIFHSSHWAKVLSETYGYDPKYFVNFNADSISTLFPLMEVRSIFTGKRAVSLPFTDFIPPVFEDKDNMSGVFNTVVQYGRSAGWKWIELRGVKPGSLQGPSAVEFYTHDLDLQRDLKQIELRFSENTRRNINKASRKGITVEKCTSLESIRHFHALNRLTRKRHGLPPQPFSFFKSVYTNILVKGYGFVFLAFYEDRCVAASIFFNFKDRVLFKYGASDPRFNHLGANHLLMWESIRFFAGKGYRILNFGRTDIDNSGLRRFKIGLGSVESRVSYYIYELSESTFIKKSHLVRQWQKRIFKRTPLPILGLLGSTMYRHFG